eukprot:TRINITY_DN62935_c0_g1_i1.p1 TRINITY_DN62935_c0_g1~~TRINITY_DN62935_c0_g1_i1.p1  ORF type:complete len:613 (-),score=131.37 TRINITY_DN62935_c0_g1_i1:54-1892(-)
MPARELNSRYARVDPEGAVSPSSDEDEAGCQRRGGPWLQVLSAVGVFAAAFAGSYAGNSAAAPAVAPAVPAPAPAPLTVSEAGGSQVQIASDFSGGLDSFADEASLSNNAPGQGHLQAMLDAQVQKEMTPEGSGYSSILGLAGEGSCARFQCGGEYVRGRSCQCTDQCTDYSNCCPDYVTLCANRPTPPPTPAPPYGVFDCQTNLDFGEVVKPERKGLALDDTTFEHCADEVPMHWPNTQQKVMSVRLFKPWGMTDPKFFGGDRHKAWKGLKAFAQASGAKFLIGVSVTCRTYNDDKEWAAGQEFIRYVGAEHVMGIAVGNEIDLQVGASNRWCVNNLWNGGGYFRTLQKRVAEFDAIPGVKGLPITAVLSMFSMNGYPFKWTVSKFLKAAWDKYGDRFKFSINVYPQFSPGLAHAGCYGSMNIGTKFSGESPPGFIPNVIADVQKRLTKIGTPDMKIWLGEHGWATHAYCVLCSPACHQKSAQQRYYQNFLKWDLSAGDGTSSCGPPSARCQGSITWAKSEGIHAHPDWYPGLSNTSSDRDFQIFMGKQESAEARGGCALPCDAPGAKQGVTGPEADHVFYFTLRDSYVFGKSETFGILEHCGSKRCKFQK